MQTKIIYTRNLPLHLDSFNTEAQIKACVFDYYLDGFFPSYFFFKFE